jgi:1,4-alpha-glucan branching enzyme
VDYGILTEPGEYKVVLNTDNPAFGGFGLVDESISHLTISDKFAPAGREWLKLYIPARSAQVLQKL